MEQTTKYQLNQWAGEDRILREDFNADNAKTEQALAAQADTLAEHTAALAGCGNCKIVYQTYTGTGVYGSDNPNTLKFDAEPLLVLVMNNEGGLMFFHRGSRESRVPGSTYYCTATWGGTTLSWYSGVQSPQFNNKDTVYHVFAWLST